MDLQRDPETGLFRGIGKIVSASLGFEAHDVLTFMLQVSYSSCVTQAVGGFILSNQLRWDGHNVLPPVTHARAMDLIASIILACGGAVLGTDRWPDGVLPLG